MAPLPPNNTARLWIDYVVGGIEHTFQVRYNANQPTIDVVDTVAAILGFIEGELASSFAVQGARVAPAGSNISVPFDISGSALAGFVGTNGSDLPANNAPREISWTGRSHTTGRRVEWSLYGYMPNTPANYRWGPGETVASSSQVIAALNAASAAGIFVAIDGTPAVWKPYVNVNFNSYWENEVRYS